MATKIEFHGDTREIVIICLPDGPHENLFLSVIGSFREFSISIEQEYPGLQLLQYIESSFSRIDSLLSLLSYPLLLLTVEFLQQKPEQAIIIWNPMDVSSVQKPEIRKLYSRSVFHRGLGTSSEKQRDGF